MNFAIKHVYLILSIVFLCVVLSKKGVFLNMLQNNKDVYGEKHSWKRTIFGLTIFLIAVLVIIFAALYAIEIKKETQFALVALIFFAVAMILQLRKMSKNKEKKRFWEE